MEHTVAGDRLSYQEADHGFEENKEDVEVLVCDIVKVNMLVLVMLADEAYRLCDAAFVVRVFFVVTVFAELLVAF